jgi:hypothetical protein
LQSSICPNSIVWMSPRVVKYRLVKKLATVTATTIKVILKSNASVVSDGRVLSVTVRVLERINRSASC